MANQDTKRYMELQMEELKSTIEVDPELAPAKTDTKTTAKPKNSRDNGAEIAKIWEDAAEYEKDLEGFEAELEIVKANRLQDIAATLENDLKNKERNYEEELKAIVLITWKQRVEVDKTHPIEQLTLIEESNFSDLLTKFTTSYPDFSPNFEADVKDILIKRLEMLIAIKKDHLKEEISDIKIMGLKPTYAKRIYKQYHGIK